MNALHGWRFTVDASNPHTATATIRRTENEHKPLVASYDVNGTITATGPDYATAVERLAGMVGSDCNEGLGMRFKSIAVWNRGLGNSGDTFETEEMHPSKEAAEAVCKKLLRYGLGGQSKVFPLSTRVEPVTDNQ